MLKRLLDAIRNKKRQGSSAKVAKIRLGLDGERHSDVPVNVQEDKAELSKKQALK